MLFLSDVSVPATPTAQRVHGAGLSSGKSIRKHADTNYQRWCNARGKSARTVQRERTDYMTSRQRMLNRSGAVEPKRAVGCWWVPARTAGGTKTAAVVMPPNGDVDNDNLQPSAGDSFDIGPGAGAESFAAQLQEAPCEHWPLQQQEPAAFVPPQHPRCEEPPVDLPQHDGSVRGPRSQFGHAVTGAAAEQPTCPTVDRGDWLPQLQTVRGRASTGTSTAASHTITRAAMLLWSCTAELHWLGICRIPRLCGTHSSHAI